MFVVTFGTLNNLCVGGYSFQYHGDCYQTCQAIQQILSQYVHFVLTIMKVTMTVGKSRNCQPGVEKSVI